MCCDLTYDLSCRMFHCVLEKDVYSAAPGWNVVYSLLGPLDIKCHLSPIFPYWFSSWMIYLLLKVGYRSPLLLFLSISALRSVNICLIYFSVPKHMLGVIQVYLLDELTPFTINFLISSNIEVMFKFSWLIYYIMSESICLDGDVKNK